jgi:hypothetical protein
MKERILQKEYAPEIIGASWRLEAGLLSRGEHRRNAAPDAAF